MEEGKLYCEHCGEDIHIVPDFEPEIEYNMAQTLNNIAKEMAPDTEPEETEAAPQPMYNRAAVAQISYLDRKEEAPTGFAALFSSSKLF